MANRFAKSSRLAAFLLAALLTACGLATTTPSHASEVAREIPTPARTTPVDFATEILPILRAHCVACHNEKQAESGLVLESPAAILKGGEQGPAVVAGKSAESLLLKLAAARDTTAMRPPDNPMGAKPLSDEQLGLVKLWIDQGAAGSVAAQREVRWQPLASGYRPILATAVSSDGQWAVCGRGNGLFAWHLPSGAAAIELVDPSLELAHRDMVRSLAFDPTGTLLASGGFRKVKLWRAPGALRRGEWSHEAVVTAVAAAGGVPATGDEQGKLRVWDLKSGRTLQTIAAHQAAVTGLAFSDDGAVIYSASLDQSLRAWKVADGSPAGRPLETASPIHALLVISNGGWLAAGHADGMVGVWDAKAFEEEAAKPLAEIKAHGSAVTALESLPGATGEFLSGGEDGFVRRWDAKSGKQLAELKAGGPVASVAARADGGRIAAAGAGHATLWNAQSGKSVVQLTGDPRLAAKVAAIDAQIAFTKSAIALAKADIKAYEGAERRVKTTAESVTKAEEELAKAEKARDEKKQAVEKAGEDKKKVEAAEKALADAENAVLVAGTVIQRAKAVAERAVKTLAEEEQAVARREELQKEQEAAREAALAAAKAAGPFRSLAFCAGGTRLAVGCDDGAVHFFDTEAGTHTGTQTAEDTAVRAMAITSDGTLISAAGQRAILFSTAGGWRLERTIGTSDAAESLVDRVLALDFSPDGRWLVTGGGIPSRSGELKIWNAADGRLVRELAGAHSDCVFGVRFSPDGQHVATAGADRLVKVFGVESGELERTFAGHTGHALGVSWSGDGKLLASCGGDNCIKLWDFQTGLPVRTMKGTTYQIGSFKREVTAVAFLGGSEQILACSGDGTVRLHRTTSDNDILTFAGSLGYQYSASVTPDGRTVLAGGNDGTLRVWSGQERQPKRTFPP